jgi:DNA-binding GntR family transcriptional regulator
MGMTELSPQENITRRYLHDEVVDRLRELILDGDLAPNSRVVEIDLCERFGISRTPLREAIKILATEGLLELLPNRGARVASLSPREIDEMVEVVAGLEATAGDLAARKIADEEIDAIEALTAQMTRAWQAGDEARYFRLNRDVHEAIMAASRNDVLAGLYASMSGRIQRARYSAKKTAEQWVQAIEDHQRMIELLRARDAAGLSHLLRAHLRSKKPIIAAAFGEQAQAGRKTAP